MTADSDCLLQYGAVSWDGIERSPPDGRVASTTQHEMLLSIETVLTSAEDRNGWTNYQNRYAVVDR